MTPSPFTPAGVAMASVMAGIKPPPVAAENDEQERCDCSERAKPGQYYHCPICDAEWPAEDDADDEPRVPGTPREEFEEA